ncbi:hypothetical protein PMAYCL1PPCAC_03229, partial [Pristionchus mayeri]
GLAASGAHHALKTPTSARPHLLRHSEIVLNLLGGLLVRHLLREFFNNFHPLEKQLLFQFTNLNVLLQKHNFNLGAAHPVDVPKFLERFLPLFVHFLRQFLHIFLSKDYRVILPIQFIHTTNEIGLRL